MNAETELVAGAPKDRVARAAGASKPPAGKPRRGRPRRTEVEPRQMLALRGLQAGRSRKEIAEELGVDVKTVGRWLQEPAVQAEVATHRASASTELQTHMAAHTAEGWAIFQGLLQSPDPRIRLRACLWLLDRTLSGASMDRPVDDVGTTLNPMPTSLTRLLEVASHVERGEVG